ncbi:MAG: hypothetical protein ACLPJH_08070 [Myxococcaceae bacterium]
MKTWKLRAALNSALDRLERLEAAVVQAGLMLPALASTRPERVHRGRKSKFRESDIRKIQADQAAGKTLNELAKSNGITRAYVSVLLAKARLLPKVGR